MQLIAWTWLSLLQPKFSNKLQMNFHYITIDNCGFHSSIWEWNYKCTVLPLTISIHSILLQNETKSALSFNQLNESQNLTYEVVKKLKNEVSATTINLLNTLFCFVSYKLHPGRLEMETIRASFL